MTNGLNQKNVQEARQFPDFYPNYDSALANCRQGYQAPDFTDMIAQKTKKFRQKLINSPPPG